MIQRCNQAIKVYCRLDVLLREGEELVGDRPKSHLRMPQFFALHTSGGVSTIVLKTGPGSRFD